MVGFLYVSSNTRPFLGLRPSLWMPEKLFRKECEGSQRLQALEPGRVHTCGAHPASKRVPSAGLPSAARPSGTPRGSGQCAWGVAGQGHIMCRVTHHRQAALAHVVTQRLWGCLCRRRLSHYN